MTHRRGLFIVFEGLDRTGKTTQSKQLYQRILNSPLFKRVGNGNDNAISQNESTNNNCMAIRFPDRSTAVGTTIDAYLRTTADHPAAVNDHAIHLLFAANRWEWRERIQTALQAGTHIVCDRYSYSGVAYSAAKGLPLEWCSDVEIGLPEPDLVFYLRMSESEATSREGFGQERYETTSFQKEVRKWFDQLSTTQGSKWKTIDVGNRSIDEIHGEIYTITEKTLRDIDSRNLPVQFITKETK